jgi:hypothetical protein
MGSYVEWNKREEHVKSYIEIIKKYGQTGLRNAAVYGRMESYTRFENGTGTCFASINKIAKDIGISSRGVERAIQDLRRDGYLVCKTEKQWVAKEGNYVTNEYIVLPLRALRE